MRIERHIIEKVAQLYELYGFEPLETSALEYADALGKFLPDQDRPNAAVFSFQDDDEQWLALRYDLTAPLARHVAQHYDGLAKPYRRYEFGPVWRNEKPGPGRFRQFIQCDADIVASPLPEADAEICILAYEGLVATDIAKCAVSIRVNNRKLLDAVMYRAGIQDPGQELTLLRAIDKLDRLGLQAVEQLLGEGRKDESGDFTPGAKLQPEQIKAILDYLDIAQNLDGGREKILAQLESLVGANETGKQGIAELSAMHDLLNAQGYDTKKIAFDPAIVRGLEYYTGPVFEAQYIEPDADTGSSNLGSIGGGGRYDGLIKRFKGIEVPATGFSFGVSRLAFLLSNQKMMEKTKQPLVVVLVMDRDHLADSYAMTSELRAAGIRSEIYMGGAGMKAQFKYADRRGAALAILQGSEERANDVIQIKDLALGKKLSGQIDSNESWRSNRPAQFEVARESLVTAVKENLSQN